MPRPALLVLNLTLLVAATMTSATAQTERPPQSGYDRPARSPHGSRSPAVARHGMAATSQPLATLAALDVLKRGGNAADAAIAANAVLCVVEPMSCGLGGDMFAIYWDARTQSLHGLNGSGRSPYKLTREVFASQGLSQIPVEGPLSWSVPGCVAGWDDLNKKFGALPLGELLSPAIEYASEGFAVSEVIANYWQGDAGNLAQWPDSARTWLPGGHAPVQGEVFRNPRMAESLKAIARDGRDAFYKGTIAQQIVEFSESHGGYLSLRDFAEHQSEWVEPVSTNYRGYDVWELPPNGQGIAALQMLNVLEGYDLKSLGFGSADYLHWLIEAKKLAFADRARFYADPAFGPPPVAELISKPYAEARRKLIQARQAATNIPHGDPRLAHGDTVYLTVVDKDRNCCSLIQSVYFGFGSKVTPGEVGFALQNRGALFALDDEHPNRLEPHKRPFQTIIPAMITREGRPWLTFGVMGGDFQPQGHVQVAVNMIDFGMNVQEAGDAARLAHLGSATPTGVPAARDGGQVTVESGISDGAIAELQKRGHRVVRQAGGYGGYQGIFIDWQHGTLHGGSDPRKDGCALGY